MVENKPQEDKPNPKSEGKRNAGLSLVPIKPGEAIELLTRQATEQNDSAAYMLAVIYASGMGVEADPILSREWLRRAVTMNPGAVLERAATGCMTIAAKLQRALREGTPLSSVTGQIANLGRAAERLQLAAGFTKVLAGECDSPS